MKQQQRSSNFLEKKLFLNMAYFQSLQQTTARALKASYSKNF
jgi:hypothetical protein